MHDEESYRRRRRRVVGFIVQSTHELQVPPIVKYSALCLFTDRFYSSISRKGLDKVHWLLDPISESNLQLFALASIWISSKIHSSPPLSFKTLKSLGDKSISEQHFTTRDFLDAELLLMQVLKYEIGVSCIAYVFLEDLIIQLKDVARVGEHVSYEACMDIMDLLYEMEETSVLFTTSKCLAASILAAAYVITVPVQRWEFPILPWVVFVTSCKEQEVVNTVKVILSHVFEPGPRP